MWTLLYSKSYEGPQCGPQHSPTSVVKSIYNKRYLAELFLLCFLTNLLCDITNKTNKYRFGDWVKIINVDNNVNDMTDHIIIEDDNNHDSDNVHESNESEDENDDNNEDT